MNYYTAKKSGCNNSGGTVLWFADSRSCRPTPRITNTSDELTLDNYFVDHTNTYNDTTDFLKNCNVNARQTGYSETSSYRDNKSKGSEPIG